MNNILCKVAFAAALLGALLGSSAPSSAFPVGPGDSFDIAYDPTPPNTYDHVSWQLLFGEGGPFLIGQSFTVTAYDTSNNALGTELETNTFPFPVSNVSSGFNITPTTDLLGHLTFQSVDAFFDVIGGSATLDFQVAATPLPAALPLFASGLGAMGFVGWRRKRKAVQA